MAGQEITINLEKYIVGLVESRTDGCNPGGAVPAYLVIDQVVQSVPRLSRQDVEEEITRLTDEGVFYSGKELRDEFGINPANSLLKLKRQ
ncbi:MAG: hypothetical protein OXI24_21690 [Candidatus Poribacteria bacterium]|nr:hypothetical protein [Candidatus Poribacteria bacterium]